MNSLLPLNSHYFERCLEETLNKFTNPDYFININTSENQVLNSWDVNKCDKSYLPFLAWSLGVQVWNDEMSEIQKREIIKAYLEIRKIAGTKESLIKIFEILGLSPVLTENPDPMKPFFFKLELEGYISHGMRRQFYSLVNALKPLRTHYILDLKLSLETLLTPAGVVSVTAIKRLSGELT